LGADPESRAVCTNFALTGNQKVFRVFKQTTIIRIFSYIRTRTLLTNWQRPIFEAAAKPLPFLRNEPLASFSVLCILGDLCYVFNGKVGSLLDLGLGVIHPSWLLTLGGVMALFGHFILLASADKLDDTANSERGFMQASLAACRALAQHLTFGWRSPHFILIGFGALAFNGVALILDALWEIIIFGANPILLLQLLSGVIISSGLGAMILSQIVSETARRDRLRNLSPQILAYSNLLNLALGLLSFAPFLLLSAFIFVLANSAQHHVAQRMGTLESA
jgi:hypothetical protein